MIPVKRSCLHQSSPGQTEGFKEWVDGWMGGFVKGDNSFGYEKWLRGGSIDFEFARVGEREDKGGVKVYKTYEVGKKGENYAVFYFTGKRFFFSVFMKSLLWIFFKKRPTIHYSSHVLPSNPRDILLTSFYSYPREEARKLTCFHKNHAHSSIRDSHPYAIVTSVRRRDETKRHKPMSARQ
jgi:hypothetical protein